jgi:hypothetical protein
VERLTRAQILQALDRLAGLLPKAEAPTELVLVGGAALVVLYGARETTKDVDALILPASGVGAVREAARSVASEMELPEDWLNDGAKAYVHGLARGDEVLRTPSLVVRSVAVQQLLAMKLSAWRDDVDIADARLLLSRVRGPREAIWRAIEPHLVPGRELKARYAFEDLWETSDATD